ncbi:MAG: hypothetical protein ACRDJW_15715 [Thermomicrobiales bacterium]
MADETTIRSSLVPGSDLISAVLNRDVMGLADRGGASGLVGERWADVCAEWTGSWAEYRMLVPDEKSSPLVVDRVARLDHRPEIERAASKRALQNPDLLLVGTRDGRVTIQAADAKFSVETARSKQVSQAVVEALLGLGPLLTPVIGELPATSDIVPGVFLCPDYPLTHVMLRRRQGITRVTVKEREVVLVPALAKRFFASMEGESIMPVLAGIDQLPVRLDESLLAGLYYFRLSRAAVGCWVDSVKPLLVYNDTTEIDVGAVQVEAARRAKRAKSAWDLILIWNADVGTVRTQRAAVEQVAGLPITGRELRDLIGRMAAGVEQPPSINQVRRRLRAWYRLELRGRVGPLRPPIDDLPRALQAVAAASAEVGPVVEARARDIVEQLMARDGTIEDDIDS